MKIGKETQKNAIDFRFLTEKITLFLARFHAIAHVWHCYVSKIICVFVNDLNSLIFTILYSTLDTMGWSLD